MVQCSIFDFHCGAAFSSGHRTLIKHAYAQETRQRYEVTSCKHYSTSAFFACTFRISLNCISVNGDRDFFFE